MTKAIRTRNGGTMTEAQYFGKLRSSLRKAFQWWEPMKFALNAARRKSQSDNKRLKFEYRCALCNQWFARKDVEIDHIIPCGSLIHYEDIAEFVKKLTPEDPGAYQVLCKKHHQEKTNLERKNKCKK